PNDVVVGLVNLVGCAPSLIDVDAPVKTCRNRKLQLDVMNRHAVRIERGESLLVLLGKLSRREDFVPELGLAGFVPELGLAEPRRRRDQKSELHRMPFLTWVFEVPGQLMSHGKKL